MQKASWLTMMIPCVLAGLCAHGSASEADLALAKSLQATQDRATSRVMARVITRTDRAGLDYAACHANPLFHYPLTEALSAPAARPSATQASFDEALLPGTLADTAAQSPLTSEELSRPLAWRRLSKYLAEWDYDLAEPLLIIAERISSEKWGNDGLVRPVQELSELFLHGSDLWARIEFRPEVTWVPATDENGDGYREMYGQVDPALCAPEVLEQIRGDYMTTSLARDEIEQFFFELASDWYQSLATVALEPDEMRPWPGQDTEPDVKSLLGGKRFENAFVVLRGKPYGQTIYNVFVLAHEGVSAPAPAPGKPGLRRIGRGGRSPAQGSSSPVFHQALQAELERWGGSWAAWLGLLKPFQSDVRAQLAARPAELNGLIGREGFLFFRRDLEYVVSGDLREQKDGRDPYPAIIEFHKQLQARNIDLLLVPIPTKAEVYPDRVSAAGPSDGQPYVAPYGRKLLGELSEAGVPIVDLLPALLKQRSASDELLYMPQDTHWTNRGLRLAAQVIAGRVKQYPWYASMKAAGVDYSTKQVTCTRQGDICDMLTNKEKLAYRPMSLEAQQVVGPGGKLYEDSPDSPLVMLGDSFTGVFHFEDCGHAGLSAHLAKELGVPIDLIMAQGSGPRIRGRLARRGHDAIEAKRLVIWTVVTRDLYNYWAPWKPIRLP